MPTLQEFQTETAQIDLDDFFASEPGNGTRSPVLLMPERPERWETEWRKALKNRPFSLSAVARDFTCLLPAP